MLILTPDNSTRKEVTETLTCFLSTAVCNQTPIPQRQEYLRIPITFLKSNKGQIPASRYEETFVPRCIVLEVKAQAHTCQKGACLLPLAHNQHRRTSQQGELCVEAERKGKKHINCMVFIAIKSVLLQRLTRQIFYHPMGLNNQFPQSSLIEKKMQALTTQYRFTKYKQSHTLLHTFFPPREKHG